MKALLIGATGATGRDLVSAILADERYTELVVFVRRPVGITHPRLKEVQTDFTQIDSLAPYIKGDVLFSCLGTTLAAAGSKEKQQEVDFSIPSQFSVLAKANNIACMVLLSAYGASSRSRVFYSRIKGELEDAIEALQFPVYIIFRPGLLLRTNTDRTGERISAFVLQALNRIGVAKKFRPLPTQLLAHTMSRAPWRFHSGKHVIALDDIFSF